MKYSIIITIALALSLTSLPITAEFITDTYNTGDILTSTKMNNIKAAVNSKQDRINGTCPAGQSIREVNRDGTVTCEVDSVGSGDITEVTAGPGLTGGGTSDSVTLSMTGAVSVHGAQFNLSQQDQILHNLSGLTNNGSLASSATANVQLPHGVTVNSMVCRMRHKTASTIIGRVNLNRLALADSTPDGPEIFRTNDTTTNSTSQQFITDLTANNSAAALIDNIKFSYVLIAQLAPNMTLGGCSITY